MSNDGIREEMIREKKYTCSINSNENSKNYSHNSKRLLLFCSNGHNKLSVLSFSKMTPLYMLEQDERLMYVFRLYQVIS